MSAAHTPDRRQILLANKPATIEDVDPWLRAYLAAGDEARADEYRKERLSDAAPALLDIARRVEALLTRQRWLPDGDAPESALLRDARAAIASATGGAA